VRLLCRELARAQGVECRLATKRGGELARRAAAEGGQVIGVPWAMGLDPRTPWALFKTMAGLPPDVIHAHDSHALRAVWSARRYLHFETSATLGALFGHGLPNAPPYVIAHRRVDFHLRHRTPWVRASRIIAVSQAVKSVLVSDGVPATHITVIPDGIDPDEVRRAAEAPLGIRARLGLPPGAPLAVNVAALVGHKDQRTLIHAAHAARDLAPELHWVVAGEGELRSSLEREIADLSVGDRVHLLGFVTQADALIREGDVFVMSSREEGLGSVVLHALALGKPVVATHAGGLPELVPAGWLVPVGDPAALARRVVDALGQHSAVPFPKQCTAAAMAQAVLACYRSLA
jgi:glycosyltransferase involved in cell wall biosynthesis